MFNQQHITAIIPAYNEAQAIGNVVSGIQSLMDVSNVPLIDHIIVCDNNSSDNTALIAKKAGATVIYEPKPGYGAACLSAINAISHTDIVFFIDGDNSVKVDEIHRLLSVMNKETDLVIGSRVNTHQEPGALLPQQKLGTQLAVQCINILWQQRITDLGPFRAIRFPALKALNMQDTRFGWTVEMQIKAMNLGLTMKEVPVSSIKRIGKSKISGTLQGTLKAGYDIFKTIFHLWLCRKHPYIVTRPAK